MAAVHTDPICVFIKDRFLGGEGILSAWGGCRIVTGHAVSKIIFGSSVWLLARSTLYMLLQLFCYEVGNNFLSITIVFVILSFTIRSFLSIFFIAGYHCQTTRIE